MFTLYVLFLFHVFAGSSKNCRNDSKPPSASPPSASPPSALLLDNSKCTEGEYSKATIVTGWWNIGTSKHGNKAYEEWRKNFQQLKANKIIFTNEAHHFTNWENTIIVNSSPKDMLRRTGHTDSEWLKMHAKYQNSKQIKEHFTAPNPQLYHIWVGRAFLLDHVRQWNPYQSEWFFWMDSGGAREDQYFKKPLSFSVKNMDEEKFHLFTPQRRVAFPGFNIQKPTEPFIVTLENEYMVHTHNIIQGGIYGGHTKTIPKFTAMWKSEVDRFFANNLFAGKDESILDSLYLQDTDFFEIHGFGSPEESKYYGNPWFYWFQFFNHDKKLPPYRWVNDDKHPNWKKLNSRC